MKNMKKIIAVLMSLTAITMTTSAFAATPGAVTATYDKGAVTLSAEGLPTDANTQLTVVIVPTGLGAKDITSGDIYYINQGAAGDEFKAIIADMKVKDGADFAKNTYEVRIGGALTNDYYVYEIAGEVLEQIMYGDADGNKVVEAYDATHIAQYLAGYGNEITKGADADANGVVEAYDATHIAQYLAGYGNVLGPQ